MYLRLFTLSLLINKALVKKQKNLKSGQYGFTLIEVIMAISILVLIMGVAYSSLSGIMRSKALLDDKREARLIANSILQRLSRELQLAYRKYPVMEPKGTKKYFNSTYLVGEQANLGGGQRGDKLMFMALEGGQYLPDGGTHSGVVQITYSVQEDPKSTRRVGNLKTYSLVREEMPYSPTYDTAVKKRMVFPLTSQLVNLRFRYFDVNNDKWTSDWGTGTKTKLPSMVKMNMDLMSPQGTVSKYTVAVPLLSGDS